MENHPIPQDVTGFKFKLIGSVTVKQFLYILGGGILAGITYILPISGFIKIPFALLFGGVGAALAFLPIEGRPMDVMMKNFLKALPSENQYIYKKKGAAALITIFFTAPPVVAKKVEQQTQTVSAQDEKRALLYKTLKLSTSYKADEKEQAVITNINSYFNEGQKDITHTPQAVDIAPTAIATPKKPDPHLTSIVLPHETVVAKPSPIPQKVENIPIQKPVVSVPETPITVSAPQKKKETLNEAPTIPQSQQLKGGFPMLPDTPNIVLGIIKDPRGKVMPNILVEIMDKQNIPVRAFKTNALGQFIAATPLTNGEYTMFFEDPKKTSEFEKIKITTNGSIFQPLEIMAMDQREKLRRELFGSKTTAQTQQ